jgi:hypothetical protein
MTELDRPIPDIILERYRLNELPAVDAARVAERLRQDAELRTRLDVLDQSDEEIRRAHLLDDLARTVHSRAAAAAAGSARATKSSLPHWLTPAMVVLGVMLLIGVVLRPAVGPSGTPPSANLDGESGDRIKGLRPALVLYRRTADGSETLADGSIARSGDVVRVGYRAGGKAFGVIVSVDGRGGVTVHLPKSGDRAVPLKTDSTVLLDAAYELDDAPRWERFYFITGDTPFAVQPIVDTVRAVAATTSATPPALVLPHGLDQATFSLQKEVRR